MIKLDYQDRKTFYRLEGLVEDMEMQAELLDDTEDWSIEERPQGPVNEDIAEYVLQPLEHFLELWNEVDDLITDQRHENSPLETSPMARMYSDLEERIYDMEGFIESVYDLEKSLGRAKVEARYPW